MTGHDVAGPDVADVAGRFGHLLHAAGIPVTPERSSRFARVIALSAPATLTELYWSARITLLSERRQVEVFDRVFSQVFGGLVDLADERGDPNAPPVPDVDASDLAPGDSGSQPSGGGLPLPQPAATSTTTDAEGDEDRNEDEQEMLLAAASTEERLGGRDFASLTPQELLQLRVMLRQLALAPPPRAARRDVRHPRGRTLDLRGTIGRAHRTAGDPIEQVRRRQRTRPRRLVVLCDISGSMEGYARAYLQLLHSAVGGARAEAFVFATRLTRLTRQLRTRHPDLALRRAGQAAQDWSGGTRIGEAIKVFNDRFGRRGLARGAVVVIVSDGWERGDPELLGEQMARLSRLAYRIVWVNPRSASPAYEPLVAGMAAALPYVDRFVSGHSFRALDEVLAAISDTSR